MNTLLGILKPEWLESHCVVPSQDTHSCGHSLALVFLSIKFHYPNSKHCPPEIIFSLSRWPSLVSTSAQSSLLPQHTLPELSLPLFAFDSPPLLCLCSPWWCVSGNHRPVSAPGPLSTGTVVAGKQHTRLLWSLSYFVTINPRWVLSVADNYMVPPKTSFFPFF